MPLELSLGDETLFTRVMVMCYYRYRDRKVWGLLENGHGTGGLLEFKYGRINQSS